MEFTPAESAVLDWCASNASCQEAADQFRTARAVARRFTGAGSYTDLVVPETIASIPSSAIPRESRGPFIGPDILAKELELGACSQVFCVNGRLALLEIAAYGNAFPEELHHISVRAVEG
jgi:hypothetical protein